MGLGHLRAAHALKDLAWRGILIDGERAHCTLKGYQTWRLARGIYYFLSTAKRIPLIGGLFFQLLRRISSIPHRYPERDLAEPSLSVRLLHTMIGSFDMCDALIDLMRAEPLPIINTFYATAIAVDAHEDVPNANHLVVTDTDVNRVWVARDPKKSRIHYFAPCQQVTKRLRSYGVPEERIVETGFPLPMENIGHPQQMERLKEDLFHRLLRLDPNRIFFKMFAPAVRHYLGLSGVPRPSSEPVTLTFAIGGSGVQMELAHRILEGAEGRLRDGSLRLILSAGIERRVRRALKGYIRELGLSDLYGSSIFLVYDPDPFGFFDQFNAVLRKTDVLWTKPSELSFFCALGVPILVSEPVGVHEERNAAWLEQLHAGIEPAGSPLHLGEWLFDLVGDGTLADVAWNGFLKAPKLGAHQIKEYIAKGRVAAEVLPSERGNL